MEVKNPSLGATSACIALGARQQVVQQMPTADSSTLQINPRYKDLMILGANPSNSKPHHTHEQL